MIRNLEVDLRKRVQLQDFLENHGSLDFISAQEALGTGLGG